MNSQSQLSKNSISSSNKSRNYSQIANKQQLVLKLTKQFDKNFNQLNKDIEACTAIFLKQLNLSLKMQIRFDNSISDILASLSFQTQFLQFSNKSQNRLKKTLQVINQCLKQNSFISQRQYNKFKNTFLFSNLEESVYMLKKLLEDSDYLKRKGEMEAKKKVQRHNLMNYLQELTNLWSIATNGIKMVNFWEFILKQKIQFRQLFQIFKIYERVIQHYSTAQFRQSIGLYLKQYLQKVRNVQKSKIKPIRQLQTSIIEYDLMLQNKAQQISAYLQKQRWQKYTKQYENVTNYLSQRCNKAIKFQPYGSFKNKFYLINFSDIDIGLFYEGKQLHDRAKICQLLRKIKSLLDIDRHHIQNYLYSRTYIFEKITVPFIKLQFKTNYGKNKDIVPSMDIIINKRQGLQNSILLGLYAEDQYILKFCNLIKYWAIKRDLINMKQKFEGLSSYGVILMCLYYLMSTKQIPFLKYNKRQIQNPKFQLRYNIGKQNFNFTKNYLQNFIGFIKFYLFQYRDPHTLKQHRGQFHNPQSHHIVCLLEYKQHIQLSKKVQNKDYIINMYDFIDGSNPGRMRQYLKGKFITIFAQTLECLEDRSLSFIENIYSENDNNNGWGDIDDKGKDKVMPRRGNRF